MLSSILSWMPRTRCSHSQYIKGVEASTFDLYLLLIMLWYARIRCRRAVQRDLDLTMVQQRCKLWYDKKVGLTVPHRSLDHIVLIQS